MTTGFVMTPLWNPIETKVELDDLNSERDLLPDPIASLAGTWTGTGFTAIWRPFNSSEHPGQNHFLQLSTTCETFTVTPIEGLIANRALFGEDAFLTGATYVHQVSDPTGNGLHLETGVLLSALATQDPKMPHTIIRIGSIAHGVSVLAQSVGYWHDKLINDPGTPLATPPASLSPFAIGDASAPLTMPETDLSVQTPFRSPSDGVTQAMVDNPNSVLADAIDGLSIVSANTHVFSTVDDPLVSGVIFGTRFQRGGADGPNANPARLDAFLRALEIGEAGAVTPYLQYSQTVLLDFAGNSWPHVSVATLKQTG